MKVEISGIHIPVTKDIDDFVRKKIKKIEKYLRNITTSHVILKCEKDRFETEINVLTKGSVINAKEVANELYTSIEGAIKKVVSQSKKYKEKKKSHKPLRPRKTVPLEQFVAKEEERPALLRMRRKLAKPMEVEEALMQLEVSKNSFLVFLNAETNQINVVHKKEDGNFVLIEPD
ncbi:ribosome-associated translation inhibitor RaiA [Candidatus Aerophobetes bacterium]|nr:ribosome-associated translation inhibitor RaiA [Candidatus Aerophobetes bacterium]